MSEALPGYRLFVGIIVLAKIHADLVISGNAGRNNQLVPALLRVI